MPETPFQRSLVFGRDCGHCDAHANWDRKVRMWRCFNCGAQAATPVKLRKKVIPGQQVLFQ